MFEHLRIELHARAYHRVPYTGPTHAGTPAGPAYAGTHAGPAHAGTHAISHAGSHAGSHVPSKACALLFGGSVLLW